MYRLCINQWTVILSHNQHGDAKQKRQRQTPHRVVYRSLRRRQSIQGHVRNARLSTAAIASPQARVLSGQAVGRVVQGIAPRK